MSRQWRPAGLGRVLDDAIGLYRTSFRTVLTVAFLTVFPVAVLVGLTQVFFTRGLLALLPTFADTALDAAGFDSLMALSILSNAAAPVFWLARIFLACALLRSASALMTSDPPDVRGVLAVGWRVFLTFALVSFVLTMGIWVLVVFGVIPGILFAIRFGLAPAVAAVEGAGFEASFRRSWQLTSGHAWRIIAFFVLVSLFTVVLEAAVTSPSVARQIVASVQSPDALFQPISAGWKTFEGLLSAASVTLVLPFVEFAWFFFYADLRARREGMDILVRAHDLAGAHR